jgi:RHS repeat-associated protein
VTHYIYDEAGNRTRKVSYKYTGSSPDPEFDLSGDTPPWQQVLDEFYVRDISGKEIAIYSSSSLTQWNIWGLDNVGKINADTTKYYYLKDHLGTIRVVLNSTNQVVSANDYDAWGYAMQNRSYQSGNTMYKFTGKERDNESSYDYFGARYYDSKIGRWGGVDSLFMKHYDFNTYNYAIDNPLRYIDPDGKQVDAVQNFVNEKIGQEIKPIENLFKGLNSDLQNTSNKLVQKATPLIERASFILTSSTVIRLGYKIAGETIPFTNPYLLFVRVMGSLLISPSYLGGEKEKREEQKLKEQHDKDNKRSDEENKKKNHNAQDDLKNRIRSRNLLKE